METQVTASDGSRPDLVCFDAGNEKRIIVEAKFWAGLMDNQPNAYLEQLPESGRSAFFCSLRRMSGLTHYGPLSTTWRAVVESNWNPLNSS